MSLTQVTEQAALEDKALQFLLEDEQKEKEGLKQALRVAENTGRSFMRLVHMFLNSSIYTCTVHVHVTRVTCTS